MKHLFTGLEVSQRDLDSKEELYFYWYLMELKRKGFIKDFKKSKTYQLSKPLGKRYIQPMKKVDDKIKTQIIWREHVYTPDFTIWWEKESVGVLATNLLDQFERHTCNFICQEFDGEYFSEIEVKPIFDQNNMTRLAKINIKWLYESHSIYTNVVKVPNIFEKTFTPERYLLTDKSMKPRKINFQVKTIDEYVDEI